jgi:hypothetical protein
MSQTAKKTLSVANAATPTDAQTTKLQSIISAVGKAQAPAAEILPNVDPVPLTKVQEPVKAAPEMPRWSEADEATYLTLQARRRASGFKGRGANVGSQVLKPSSVTPNPDTIVATIVGLVEAAGNVTRADLLAKMAATTFPHAKAKPQDKDWCQGYVAGAIRNGFLTVVGDAPAAISDAC